MAHGSNCAARCFFLCTVLVYICVCEGTVTLQAFKPCHMPYTPFTRSVESPCYSVVGQLPQNVQLRKYAPAIDNFATVISANVSAALQPWINGLEITANHMFEYFTGPGNSKNESLTAYLTAPLMFRPAGGKTPDASPWFVDMVLQPSVWGRDSQPPGPSRGFVQVLPFGELNVAVLHQSLKIPPGQADFEACDASLRSVVSHPASEFVVDTTSAHTPTFAFYFPRDDMPPAPAGPFDIECWVAVVPS